MGLKAGHQRGMGLGLASHSSEIPKYPRVSHSTWTGPASLIKFHSLKKSACGGHQDLLSCAGVTSMSCIQKLFVFMWIGLMIVVSVPSSGQYVRRPREVDDLHQSPGIDPRPVADDHQNEAIPDQADRVEIDADRLELDTERRILTGIGNVIITQHQDMLQADFVEYNMETQEARARGNIVMTRGGRTWEGEELSYNFRTREGDFGEFLLYREPFYLSSRESRQVSPTVIELRSARLTTCSGDQRQEFLLRARRATITDGHVLRARHVVAQLYGIPLFYTPYLKKDFDRDSNFQIVPGYSSRMGAFALTSYNFSLFPGFQSSTLFDYRTLRGFAGGQRFRWNMPESGVRGRFQAYYANDDRPIRTERQRETREGLVDNERYWIGFQHSQRFADRNLLLVDVNYVSDPFMLEDFFDREFRRRVQPENRVALSHRGEGFSAGLLMNFRLNDFYDNVNRLPELSLDIFRREVGLTGIFYESEHRGSNLERVFRDGSDRDDYDAVRADTFHTLLYPTRMAGFLTLIPRVSYRGTLYSAAPEVFRDVTIVPQFDEDGELLVDEDGLFLFDEEEEITVRDGGAQFRNVFEFGFDTSFKAFKLLNDHPNHLGTGLRHIAEPYARYTWVPEPNVRPDDLYQFDAIDRLDKRHDIRIGVRNKLQTRRSGRLTRNMRAIGDEWAALEEEEEDEMSPIGVHRVHDFIDLNTYTIYRLDPAEGQEDFDDFFFETRLRLTDWVHMDFDGAFDWYEGEVRVFNTRVRFYGDDRSSLGLEYRYNRDRRQTAQADLILFPGQRWSYWAYWRFDIEDGELEEQSYLIQRKFDCTVLGIGARGRLADGDETDWRVWAQVSLLALPRMELRLGR